VYKRAFEWNTFDLGYPSAIAVLWFVIILVFVRHVAALASARQARVLAMAATLSAGLGLASLRRVPLFLFVVFYTVVTGGLSFGWR